MGKTVIGLDIGTSSIKTVVYNLEKGVLLSKRTELPKRISDGKTIDPEGIVKVATNLLAKTVKSNKDKISAISLSTIFPTILALDSKMRPLTKILTWMDCTASPVVTSFKKENNTLELYQKTGCVVHESYPLWKILWLKKNSPKTFSKANKFVSLQEYLTYRLTGKFIVSKSIATTTSMFNIKSLDWDDSVLSLVGINREKLSQPRSPFHQEIIQKDMASKIGFKDGTCLVLGAGDGMLSHLGTGCLDGKSMSSTLGTSGALRMSSQEPVTKNELLWCYYLDDKAWVLGSAINAGWSTLKWFEKNVKNFKPPGSKINEQEPKGPVFLPFLDGERGSGYNQNMRAVFIGLNSKNESNILYHSVVEGIFFNLYSCYETICKEIGRPSQICASGGYVTLDDMLQMQADIFNKEIMTTNVKETSAVGAAIMALKSIGELADIKNMKQDIAKTFYPDKRKNEIYMGRYETYKKVYSFISKNL